MTLLPIEIVDQAHLEELLKEFTGSKTTNWTTRQFISNKGLPTPTWGRIRTFIGRTTYLRYERKQALIFRSIQDFSTGITTGHLIAVQPKGKGITTRGLITVANMADPAPDVRHFYGWRGFAIEVPRLTENAVINLFQEGIMSYYFEEDTNNPNSNAYVCVK